MLSLLLLLNLVAITYANPVLIKRHGYSLDCTSEGSEFQAYCSGYPHKYFCNDQGKVDFVSKSEFCESGCKCNGLEVATEPQITMAEHVVGNEDAVVESPNIGDMTISTSSDLVPVTPSITKRHDYVLICDSEITATTTFYSRICSNSPYKYYCTSDGKVHRQNVYAVCDAYCGCKKVPGKPCFVDRLGLAPICSEVNRSTNFTNSTDLQAVNKVSKTMDGSIEVREAEASISKRHNYAFVCSTAGKGFESMYNKICTGSPYRYYCDLGGSIRKQEKFDPCDRFCSCQKLGGQTCFIDRLGLGPICSEMDPPTNSTYPGVNTIEQEAAKSTDNSSSSSDPVLNNIFEGTTTEKPDIRPSSIDLGSVEHKRLSHNYALVCDAPHETGNLYTKYCGKSPRQYYCTSQGRVKYSDDDILCDHFCSCVDLTPNCYVHPMLVTPICSSVETGKITDMQTGAVVGHLDGSGTAVYDSAPVNPRANAIEETTPDSSIDDNVLDTSTNLVALVTRKLDKRHDFALICQSKGNPPSKLIYDICTGYPYKYSCMGTGKKFSLRTNPLCESCTCQDIVKSCYVSPYLITPVCADVETGQITSEQTGAVIGFVDGNGSAVYYQNSTTTE